MLNEVPPSPWPSPEGDKGFQYFHKGICENPDKILKVKYTCLHPSCVVYCKNGVLHLPEAEFSKLCVYEDKTIFRSPKDACRMGFIRDFRALNVTSDDVEAEELDEKVSGRDPVAALIAEHKEVLKKVEKVEERLVKRDIDGLWVATQELDNALYLHSGIMEEEILFPALSGLIPFGEGLVACINEDHREIVSLLYTFREALRDNTINDKIIGSALVALRSHIRKEDNEFFEFVKGYINDNMKEAIMAAMEQAEKAFVPKEPGERLQDEQQAAHREWFHKKALQSKEFALDTCCH